MLRNKIGDASVDLFYFDPLLHDTSCNIQAGSSADARIEAFEDERTAGAKARNGRRLSTVRIPLSYTD